MGTSKSGRRWLLVLVLVVVSVCFSPFVASWIKSIQGPRPDPYLEKNERDEQAVQKFANATNERTRFNAMSGAAKVALKRRQFVEARRLSEELLVMAERFPDNWNYGNAIHHANIVLGYLSLEAKDLAAAKRHLIEAGRTPGSPQLKSFGPNMSLARTLIQRGERDVVLEYFELCRRFWAFRGEQLDQWKQAVESGSMPDFGVSLIH